MTNSSLLFAVLGVLAPPVAHADGDAPTLTSDAGADGAKAAVNRCVAENAGPAGVTAAAAKQEENRCKAAGGSAATCTASGIMSPEAASCIAELHPSVHIADMDRKVPNRLWGYGPQTTTAGGTPWAGGIAWQVQYGANIGAVVVDAHTGEIISISCCKGRPCSDVAGPSRAAAQSRTDWT